MELSTIPNLRSNLVTRKHIDEIVSLKFDLPRFRSQAEYKRWASQPQTKYLAYNCVEAADPHQRLNKDNPPKFLKGFCVDWDAKLTDLEYDECVGRMMDSAYPANWISRSYSGGLHAVYFFEGEILCHGKSATEKFLRRAAKEMNFDGLARKFDKGNFLDPFSYVLYGSDWKEIDAESRIDLKTLHYWQYESSSDRDFDDGVIIPLDVVKAEIDQRFPGAWDGPFREGSQGVRFWDPTADNPRAAVVRERGFQCFTGDRGFMRWVDVFGTDFVRDYEVNRIGEAIVHYWFDGKNYFVEDGNGGFVVSGRDDTKLDVMGRHGLSDRPRREDNLSEARRAMYQINTGKRVEAGIPFVFTKSRIVKHEGQRYFNTSRIKPLTPADGDPEWGEGFPTIVSWMETMFGEEQLKHEIGWLSYAYRHAYAGAPKRGHAHFLVGPPNTGKTLYNKSVLGGLFGGGIKASEYLCGKDSWTDYLFEYGMWLVDDEAPSESASMHTAFTAKLKEHVANDTFLINGKYMKSGRAFWRGRISITLNDDPISMRLLPDLDMSIKDKVMIFKCNSGFRFTAETKSKVDSELPHFARWLLNYEIPSTKDFERFGVQAYINPALENMAKADSRYSHITELMNMFRDTLADDAWEGTTSELLVVLGANENNRILLRDMNPRKLGWGLNHIFSKGHDWLSKPRHRIWRVDGS
ncbi:MAG: hypothetical protein CL532_01660 [Aestuariivita sp.]|nr:hypothetical protein [Aestuariivita sp.]|tara:strand:- start:6629 stop:8707 length:2079 start_codon:yes stop_codon:yes gene_type:complete